MTLSKLTRDDMIMLPNPWGQRQPWTPYWVPATSTRNSWICRVFTEGDVTFIAIAGVTTAMAVQRFELTTFSTQVPVRDAPLSMLPIRAGRVIEEDDDE